jgi:hypothetical protein
MVKRKTQKEHNEIERKIQEMKQHLINFNFSGMSNAEEATWFADFSNKYSELFLLVAKWHMVRGR